MQISEETFGHCLRSAREKAGLSQSELERRSGVPKTRLSRYENDHILPSVHTLKKLAGALGVSETVLLGQSAGAREEFLTALEQRGVLLDNPEQARTLANAIADLLSSLGARAPGHAEAEVG